MRPIPNKLTFKHQENKKESPFLFLRFLPNDTFEVDLCHFEKNVDLVKLRAIIKRLFPTSIEIT